MITKQTWIKTIIALFLALCIAFYVNQFLRSLSQQTNVVIAAVDIPAKTVVERSMLTTVSVHMSDQSILVPNALKDISDAIGTITLAPLRSGDVLVNEEGKLVRPDQAVAGMPVEEKNMSTAFFIPPDFRAISLRVDSEGSLGFSLKPGDKVDVIYTSTGVDSGGVFSKTILRNITIFDISPISEKDRQSGNNQILQNVTLLVSPSETQVLSLSKRKGKIDFVLTPLNPDTKQWSLDKPTYPFDITKDGG